MQIGCCIFVCEVCSETKLADSEQWCWSTNWLDRRIITHLHRNHGDVPSKPLSIHILSRGWAQIVFTFTSSHSYFRKIPRFDNYFQIGWNHHLALHLFSLRFNAAPTTSHAKCIHTHRQDLMMAGVAARRAFFIHSGGKAGNAIFVGQPLYCHNHQPK